MVKMYVLVALGDEQMAVVLPPPCKHHAHLLFPLSTVRPNPDLQLEEVKTKLKVTMVCWSADDLYVVTAVNDCSLKVWDSHTGELVQELKVRTGRLTVSA